MPSEFSRAYNEFKVMAKGYYQDARASKAGMKAEKYARNGIAKSKQYIGEANVVGRDTAFTAQRTWGATSFSGKSIGKHAAIGAGIGAAANVGAAYADGDRDLGRAGVRGAFMGAGIGAGVGIAKPLMKGYASQAETRMGAYAKPIGPQMGTPKSPNIFQRWKNR